MRGVRHYELSNHLGNVLSVVSDRLITRCVDGDTLYQTNFHDSVPIFSNPNAIGPPDGFYQNNHSWTGNFVELSLLSNTLHIQSPNTTPQHARVNFIASKDILRAGATYEVHITITKANGSGQWLMDLFDLDYNQRTRYTLSEGQNTIQIQTDSYNISRLRFIYSVAQDDIEYTFSDVKIIDITGDSLLTYVAEVVSATDYSPFGAQLSGRTWYGDTVNQYRFGGAGGHEKEFEVLESWYDFQGYGLDTRLGRRPSPDPLKSMYPSLSPYVNCANNPLVYVDRDGQKIIIYYQDDKGNNASYEYGSKQAVPNNAFVQNTIAALNHIKVAGAGQAPEIAVNEITNSTTKTLSIVETQKGAYDMGFEENMQDQNGNPIANGEKVNPEDVQVNTGTLQFNPYAALSNAAGTEAISPATALSHEIGHAFNAFFTTQAYLIRSNTYNAQYQDDEEQFATTMFEHIVASYQSEWLRTDHTSGEQIMTSSPTSNTPIVTTYDQLGKGQAVEFK
jgi:hypothetical protein